MDEYVNGTVKISEDVIVKIAQTAACEIEGVARICPKAVKSQKNSKGIIFENNEDGSLTITVQIAVAENYKIIEVSEKVQNHVAESVNTMTGITVKQVNVNVTGLGDGR